MHVALPSALQMIKDGEICDAKTIILLQHLMIERLEMEIQDRET